MLALAKNPDDQAAEAIVAKDRSYHSRLSTTRVATLVPAIADPGVGLHRWRRYARLP
jgi:hypothetical protein